MKAKEIYLDYASSALSFQANPGVVHQFGMKEKNKLKNLEKKNLKTKKKLINFMKI